MSDLHTVRDVLALWPSRPEMARDLSVVSGDPVSADRIHKWAQSGAIPAGYHGRILRAAQIRGLPLTAEDLVTVHDQPGKRAA